MSQRFFVSYELLEMTTNRFRYFAGDAGYRLTPKSQLRLIVMEVDLSERHLSNDVWAQIVEGDGIEGYLRGYELSYDRFIARGFYVMANAGYIDMSFENVETGASYDHQTLSVGTGFGYQFRDVFGIRGLYINPSIPIRFLARPFEETALGSGTVQGFRIAPSVWTFVGIAF